MGRARCVIQKGASEHTKQNSCIHELNTRNAFSCLQCMKVVDPSKEIEIPAHSFVRVKENVMNKGSRDVVFLLLTLVFYIRHGEIVKQHCVLDLQEVNPIADSFHLNSPRSSILQDGFVGVRVDWNRFTEESPGRHSSVLSRGGGSRTSSVRAVHRTRWSFLE
jgi:hypothetical protein